jgi:hypothetical protein
MTPLLSVLAMLTLYEFLWASTEESLPELHAQYDQVDETAHGPSASEAQQHAQHILAADLDGDGRDDYTLVLLPHQGDGFAVWTLLGSPKATSAYKALPVIRADSGQAEYVSLALRPSGASGLPQLAVTPRGAPPRCFMWHRSTKTIREVVP